MARSLLLLSLILFACNNLEDANIPARQTFIRFFGSSRSFTSAVVEADADGYILAGNVAAISDDSQEDKPEKHPGIIVIKTDDQGNEKWRTMIPDANVHSIKRIGDGYLITGEGIELNPTSTESSEFVNQQFLLIKLTSQGVPVEGQKYAKDSTITVSRGADNVTLKVDFKAVSSTLIDADHIVTLGSFKVPGAQERSITMSFDLSNITTPVWRKNLNLQNFDYVNAPFLGYATGNLVWASTAAPSDINQSKYLSIISVPPDYASPSNNSLFGKTDEGNHDVKDFQPSGTGFAAIGTYTSKGGAKDAFYVKVDQAGNVMPESVKYFDCGNEGEKIVMTSKGISTASQDDGSAICYTSDGGFVLACSMSQTVDKGNGGTDIVLVKIDAFGNYKWDKLLGGSGNEAATSVRELPDGTLLISGTSTISNISSMFIIRTDRNGDTKE
jgi:hypothetical protein